MKLGTSGITSIILLIMATSSLMSMFLLLRIDGIIHGDLYKYGLQFNGEWAVPYWTMALSIFGIGWFNIISAIALQLYIFVSGRKEARIKSRQNKVPRFRVPAVQKAITEETVAIERAGTLIKEIRRSQEQEESREPAESQVSGQVRMETEAQKEIGGAEPNKIPQKQPQETPSTESTNSEKSLGEASTSPKGLEQKTSSREEDKDALISAGARVTEGTGLTDAEELIYNGAQSYFHPSTKGRSYKTDFPDREFKQRELKGLYVEKKINKEDYVEGLIKAFPTRLEEDVSDKILDYLEDWLQHMSNTEDSLAIVEECRQDKEKWNTFWKKVCRQYERELQQEALTA